MGINRRNYLKTLGVMGGSLSFAKSLGAPSKNKEEETEYRDYKRTKSQAHL